MHGRAVDAADSAVGAPRNRGLVKDGVHLPRGHGMSSESDLEKYDPMKVDDLTLDGRLLAFDAVDDTKLQKLVDPWVPTLRHARKVFRHWLLHRRPAARTWLPKLL